MSRAELTLTIPEGVWIGELSRDYPTATFRILSAFPGEDVGVGLLEVLASDFVTVLKEMDGSEAVTEHEPLGRTKESVLVQFETTDPLLLEPMQISGVPIEMPFEIVEGKATLEVAAPEDRISSLGEQLEAFGIEFTVEHIHQQLTTEQFLTDSQRRVIETGIDMGYYDVPRECSLIDLSDELGIAKSTCSETLHRAEGKLIKQFVAEGPMETFLRSSG